MRAIAVVVGLTVLAAGCGDSTIASDDTAAQCADGLDNDGDGTIDFPEDLGCTSATDDTEDSQVVAQCQDGRDNDGDGKVDYPNDPGCFAPQSDNETDDCPSGPNCPQCSDGKDNDSNGATDYPNDPGCASASDNEEFVTNPNACGASLVIQPLPASNVVDGVLDASSTSQITSPCGAGTVPARAYVLHIDAPKVVEITTDDNATVADTIIDLRSMGCVDQAAEIACNDDIDTDNSNSKLTASLQAGTYFIIVAGVDSATTGAFHLEVKLFSGEGNACTSPADCGPGLVCRTPHNGTSDVCTKPVCNDGMDDDGDGKTDYPNDPGCATPDDADELDDCPTGPNCPACADGVDNDNDTKTDYPDDTTCRAASDGSESCPTTDGVTVITMATTTGDTSMAHDDVAPPSSCQSTSSAPDRTYRLDVPALSSLEVALDPNFDAVLSMYNSTCAGTTLACVDDSTRHEDFTLTGLAAGSYYIVVDGYSSNDGDYTIGVSGTIVNGERCDGTLATAGALTCGPGYACLDAGGGTKTCQVGPCANGLDDDGDGKADYPEDPGCDTSSDPDETDDCPSGPNCPVCADGVDNDSDGETDYPNDTTCLSASGTSESCRTDGVPVITTATTTGDTSTATDDVTSPDSCASAVQTGPDQTYRLDLPALSSFEVTIDPDFDSVISLLGATCGSAPLQCNDSPDLSLTNLAGGTYYIVVDGYFSDEAGAYSFTVSGTIKNGERCDGPLAMAGALTCGEGYACDPGTVTCQPSACNDGIDNDGDGEYDYPVDPGCTSFDDNDETDDCPSGPNCPACSDGVDNDGDGKTDYPHDTTCGSAADTSEACATSEGIVPITAASTTGDTSTADNDIKPMCVSSSSAPDRTYSLQVPALSSLEVSIDPDFDSVISLYDMTCGAPLDCNDSNEVSLSNVAAGTYIFVVDGYGGDSGEYEFTVSGTIVNDGRCDGALAMAGALTCGPGYSCLDASGGTKTCQPAPCNNGLDDDGDGKIDYPDDPGCGSPEGVNETDDCPTGPNCPQCSDGQDNDGDGMADYPDDMTCQAAGGTSEACASTDNVAMITTATTTGDTSTANDDFILECGGFGSGPDRIYRLDVPALTSLDVDIDPEFDSVIALFDSTCGGDTLDCSDPNSVSLSNVAAGTYYFAVDGYYTDSQGEYEFTVSGTIANGGRCDGALATSGAFTCGSGYTCKAAGGGTMTCQP